MPSTRFVKKKESKISRFFYYLTQWTKHKGQQERDHVSKHLSNFIENK